MKSENIEGAGITYVIMPIEILQNEGLTPSEKILYCYLGLFKKGVCFQSNEKLAEMTGLDESTVKRGLKKLSEMGFIFIEFVNNNSAMRRIYTIFDNPKKLEYLAKKGVFGRVEPKKEEPATQDHKEEPVHIPVPAVDNKRPRRSDYASDEEFEKAFYKWNETMV